MIGPRERPHGYTRRVTFPDLLGMGREEYAPQAGAGGSGILEPLRHHGVANYLDRANPGAAIVVNWIGTVPKDSPTARRSLDSAS